MFIQRKHLLTCLAAAVAAHAAAVAHADEQEWQCQGAASGQWSCATVSRPSGPFATAARPLRPPATPAPGGDAVYTLTENMDWVPRAQLEAARAASLPQECSGAYVEPPIENRGADSAVFGTVYAASNETELQQNPDIARFSGDVTVRHEDRRLRADRATYYREENRVEIEGTVQYREPGLLARGDKATLDTKEGTAILDNARFVMHEEQARGAAKRVRRNGDKTIDLKNASYTQCEPGHDDWQIAARSIHIDRETGQGTARGARLEVRDVPVLYTPYIRFPIDDRRMSGLLWPYFANASQNGLDISQPYYLNLAPNYDATFTPRYMGKRGAMLSSEFRYLNDWGRWTASGAYLPDDDDEKRDRWLTGLQHDGSPFAHVTTHVDYTKVSDEDYLRNLSATGLDVKRSTHLLQNGSARWQIDRNWQARAVVQQYQLLDVALKQPYKILPRLEVARDFSGEPFRFDYALKSEYTAFEHRDNTLLTGQRLYVEPQVAYPMEWASGYVKPTLGYQSISYTLDQGYCNPALPVGTCLAGSKSPSVAAPQFSVDSGYFFERDMDFGDGSYLQTLEPRAHYLWVDSENHEDIPNFDTAALTFSFEQLFRRTRFSGHDRIADANQGSLSVTSRIIDDSNGRELLTASIGQIYYFDDRRVTLANLPLARQSESNSEVAAELQVQPARSLWVSGTTLWDTGRDRVSEGGMQVHWAPDDQTIVNLGYRYRRERVSFDLLGNLIDENIDQVDFSTTLPLSNKWQVFARYQYDLTNKDNLEALAGLQYNACCWSVRMVYQEGVDWERGRDYGFYMQFVLRGLGGLGKDLDRLLAKSIFGFNSGKEEYGLGY